MEFLDNKTQGRVVDKLKEDLRTGTKVSIISAYFTIYAYEHLRKELQKIDGLRLLFSEPTFIKDKKNINREFKLSGSYERGLAGDRYEMSLKNELKQSEIAKECADWIRNKVEVRAYDEEYSLPQKMYLMENKKQESSCIFGSSDFTSGGLGLVASSKPEMNTYVKNSMYTSQMVNQFNMFWNDTSRVKDVKESLLQTLEGVYKENTSEFIYFVTLYNIFKDYLDNLSEEDIVKSKTGFKESVVWNKLYNFQKDGVLGAIDKLEKYNGCILADSVGLGKTFEALAVIKYYESRNNRVLVLCPKKLRENWLTYKGNRKDNVLEKDRLNYDVLNHTDLSRYSGHSGEINLEKIYWENYDLIVIDESHNFRNNNNKKDDKETRYSRLLNQIIKKGIKTKVLMLSATPVNNKMNDLKNQIAFATEGDDTALNIHGIKSIEQTLRKAQMAFNRWSDLPDEKKKLETLLELLEMDYFKLLDMLTIARSRKHIQKYYDTSSIGKFPERLKPLNIKSDIDTLNEFIPLPDLNRLIRSLNLAIYSPIKYVLPSKLDEYSKKYDTKTGKSVFKQVDREESLVHLMRINILKRMESSIHSFGLTVSKLLQNIDLALKKLDNCEDIVEDFDIEEIDILIATDCISEGQNLQDCDYLVNYDIHWNPVRIIQRFGRIDRIGSKNDIIQLVNFWPNMELDEYINLEARVS